MKVLKFWKTIIVALIILYGSLTSGDNLNKFSFFTIPNIDKLIHFLFYFSLALTFISALYKVTRLKKYDQYLITFVFSISYGLIMEVLQYYITVTRSADIYDALANTLGCIIGIILFKYLKSTQLIKYL